MNVLSRLSFLKYPLWTLKEYIRHPYWSLKNTIMVLAVFFRTIIIGGRANKILKRHYNNWSSKTRGRYIWRIAHKYWAPWILRRAGVSVTVHYKEKIDWSKPYIVVANHASTIDPLILLSILPVGRVIAKKEALKYPVVGTALKYGAQIVVDRFKNHHNAMSAVRKGIIDEWKSCTIVIFPEGTRTKDGNLGEFRYGAFVIAKEMNLPIVPIAIKGGFEILPKGSLLRFRPTNVEIIVGGLIESEFVQARPVPELAIKARNEIFQLLFANKNSHATP